MISAPTLQEEYRHSPLMKNATDLLKSNHSERQIAVLMEECENLAELVHRKEQENTDLRVQMEQLKEENLLLKVVGGHYNVCQDTNRNAAVAEEGQPPIKPDENVRCGVSLNKHIRQKCVSKLKRIPVNQ